MSETDSTRPLERPPLPLIWESPPGGTVLVLAPHQDDEVCGCGGALFHHAQRGDAVHVEFLTSGASGDPGGHYEDLVKVREEEAGAASAILGTKENTFWGMPDNFEVTPGDVDACVERLIGRIEETGARILYYPWIGEAHSDHHATALVARTILEREEQIRGIAYEVWSPLPAQVILDITSVRETKERALASYASQLRYTDLVHHVMGLNAHRGVYLKGRGGYGEAFLLEGKGW